MWEGAGMGVAEGVVADRDGCVCLGWVVVLAAVVVVVLEDSEELVVCGELVVGVAVDADAAAVGAAAAVVTHPAELSLAALRAITAA
jgi:TRAP-type mannitol/chloroaromatic compound transport system permease large subunit